MVSSTPSRQRRRSDHRRHGGALIVEGDFDDIPELRGAADRVLILNEVLFDHRETIETYDTVWPEAVPRCLSVNGQREPAIRMRPGGSNAGGLFTPATRTTFTLCTSLPLTASEDHKSVISKVCSLRLASVPTCWWRPELSARTLFGR